MKNSPLLIAALSLACLTHAFTQEAKPGGAAANPTPSQAELIAAFQATLTDATFTGHWNGIKDGALTPEKQEEYHIVSVTQGEGDHWTINAKMKYQKQEIVVPIPVQVKWAGDTAVICVDKLTIPGGGTYDARVLVFKNTYAGTWSGGERGGLLSGIITNGKQ